MRLGIYQAETARIAAEQAALLQQAREILAQQGGTLSGLEQSGVLHAWQLLIENAIGKAKQILKVSEEPVPVSAYDAFAVLARLNVIEQEDLGAWNAIVGLRNRIVHDYMNVDMTRVNALVQSGQHQFVVDFLLKAFAD